jgi:hypothetical protein
VLLGFNQATGHPSASWNQPSHRPPQCSLDSTKSPATPVLLGFNQATDHPSALWNQPSHRPSQCSLESTKPLAILVLLGFNQATGHPNAPWIQPSHRSTPIGVDLVHCTRLQCSLHFWAYTLAMQCMVSAFIQHPSTYPSRYIIITNLMVLEYRTWRATLSLNNIFWWKYHMSPFY